MNYNTVGYLFVVTTSPASWNIKEQHTYFVEIGSTPLDSFAEFVWWWQDRVENKRHAGLIKAYFNEQTWHDGRAAAFWWCPAEVEMPAGYEKKMDVANGYIVSATRREF